MFISRLPPTIKKNRYDFSFCSKWQLMNYISQDLPVLLLKQGSLSCVDWLKARHSLVLLSPLMKIFRGSSLDLIPKGFSFLNSNNYWVFVFPNEGAMHVFFNYFSLRSKRPTLLTLILQRSFLNLTSKLDPYAFLSLAMQDKYNSWQFFQRKLAHVCGDVILSCLWMTFILPLFIVLLIQYLWYLSGLFINYNSQLC